MEYSGSLTREQFMFPEMRLAAQLWLEGLPPREIEQKVFKENLYQYPTEREIKSKSKACLKRLECISGMPVMLEELANGTFREARQAALIAMMLQSRLMAEFMVEEFAQWHLFMMWKHLGRFMEEASNVPERGGTKKLSYV